MPPPPEEFPDQALEAERIYVEAHYGLELDESLDVEALCAAHPAHAAALRRAHALWLQASAEMPATSSSASLAARLEERFGPGADPRISLQGRAAPASGFSSEVLKRISDRHFAHSRYKFEGEVARGGMGAILRVWDEDLRRHLAMKVVLGKGESASSGNTPDVPVSTLARFLEEAQITGQLDHPGIVPVHELGLNADGRVYFTMKLVKGKTLKVVFEELEQGRGGWTQTRVLGLILRVCEALAYAHDKQVIHRDLKPANVMVGKFGEVYVMDWGLAKVLSRKEPHEQRVGTEPLLATADLRGASGAHAGPTPDAPLHTMEGDVIGTPAYMSPEQAAGRVSEMRPPADVYSLGAMLYHLLAGHMPYVPRGARPNNLEVLRAVQAGPPAGLHGEAPQVPAELVAICEKAMARKVPDRYANTSELADDLAAYIEGRVVHAYETGAWAETRKWVKRNKPLAAALAAAVLAMLVGGVGFAIKAEQATRAAQLARNEATRADDKTHEAQRNLTLAQEHQQRAEAETAKVLRLSDVKVLQELEAEADQLWPPHPAEIGKLESWLVRARALASNLTVHSATLQDMRARAPDWSAADRLRNRTSHPRAAELAEMEVELDGLLAQLRQNLEGAAEAAAQDRVAELEPEVDALTAMLEVRRTWRFETHEDQWQHDVLSELTANLEKLESGLLAEDGITPDHGWSLPKRLAFARGLEAGALRGGESATLWAQALPAIRAAYPGLDLQPQVGLLPIGPDPAAGLWEFAHLMTGAPAERGPDGGLILTEETGVVLVLLPGGSSWMGAQANDPAGTNYDPQAQKDEAPVHEVELSAFFLSKYELTQGQWKRLTGSNPSFFGPDGRWWNDWLSTRNDSSLLHPVEQVSWEECMTWLPRAGLVLPSEAQWEYAARSSAQTPYWSGSDLTALQGVANLLDFYGKHHGSEDWPGWEPDLDDGCAVHAPVGSFRANGFGLHDVHGNLWEWCLDGYEVGFYGESPRTDPVCTRSSEGLCMMRGGGFNYGARFARSSSRNYYAPSNAEFFLGARPARVITE